MRILFHVQHLLGVGHDRRAALIARALTEGGHKVVVLRGGFPVAGSDYGAATIEPLPPARTADDTFKVLLDAEGRPVDEAWRRARAAAVLNAFDRHAPDVVIVESFPFARGAFRFELVPLLAAARSEGVPTVVSVRDILVSKSRPGWVDGVVAEVERLIDHILVHGDPAVIPLAATFAGADRLGARVRYTGYVAAPAPEVPNPRSSHSDSCRHADGSGEVVVSIGGGAVGEPLLRAALAARSLSPLAEAPWRLLVGPDLGHAVLNDLRAAAPAGVVVERARSDFPALLARCRLSISQAGYNTVLDVLQAGCRAVFVPYATSTQTEQAIRARLLAVAGRAVVVEGDPEPVGLADAIARALAGPPPSRPDLPIDGAAQTARALAAIVRPADWNDLRIELDRWAALGRIATFWWRDDDAVTVTPQLERLLALSRHAAVPVALAVIPARAGSDLAATDAVLLQHGHAHEDHAVRHKSAELGDERPLGEVMADLRDGWDRLARVGGSRALPVLVPPWNRIAASVAAQLPGLGYLGLSTFADVESEVPGLARVNAHIDPVAWRNGGGFAGTAPALAQAIRHLRRRRRGGVPDTPTGLLTHHLVMDEATWDFVARFLAVTRDHPAVRWMDAAAAFDLAPAAITSSGSWASPSGV